MDDSEKHLKYKSEDNGKSDLAEGPSAAQPPSESRYQTQLNKSDAAGPTKLRLSQIPYTTGPLRQNQILSPADIPTKVAANLGTAAAEGTPARTS